MGVYLELLPPPTFLSPFRTLIFLNFDGVTVFVFELTSIKVVIYVRQPSKDDVWCR